MMAKEPEVKKAEPEEKAKKERRHYPKWDHKVTSGFDTLDTMGDEGWHYLDMWNPDSSVTSHGGVQRNGIEPFFLWRREQD